MANLYTKAQQQTPGGQGGLAAIFRPNGGDYAYVNVVKDYIWTLSKYAKETAPRVILTEYQINETTIRRQTLFYATAVKNFFGDGNILQPYEELYQKDAPTGFVYDFPYFSDINFQISTPMWTSLDTLEQGAKATEGLAGAALGESRGAFVGQAINLLAAGAGVAASFAYPKVGITDRPRLFQSHEPRSIEIKFPLYNTLGPNDWKKNRELCELLVNQNLYNKRDFITSIPPVFYEVVVIGQHYSFASCVTNLTIYNRGNMRQMFDEDLGAVNVPDAYEVNITLTDMVMPSKNLFQSIRERPVTTTTTGFTQSETQTGVQDIKNAASSLIDRVGSYFNESEAPPPQGTPPPS